MTIKLPKKFEICTKYNRTDKYVLEKYEHGMYRIAGEGYKPAHTEAFVQACLTDGDWIMTKDLDEVAGEREMVFPFTAVYNDHDWTTSLYEMYLFKGTLAGYVSYTYKGDTWDNAWTVEDCNGFIKEGIWIVKHVGEKSEEPLPSSTIGNGSIIASSINGAPQAPQSTTTSVSTLVLNVDTTASVESVKRLTEALEALAISYESVIALQKEMRNV